MAFQLSPGVNISEVDLTTVVPSVATSIGGIAGDFAWGPVEQVTTINSEIRLAETFGKPDENTYKTFFTAANFLSYSGDLRVVRGANTSSLNAVTSGGTAIQVKNRDDYEQNFSGGLGSSNTFIGKCPGTLVNGVTVRMADANTFSGWTTWKSYFDSAPATSDYAANKNCTFDELHILVVDTEGVVSGTKNAILEKFAYVSKAGDAKNSDGSSNYYKDVINNKSKYIWWGAHNALGTNWGETAATRNGAYANLASAVASTLAGGTYVAATTGEIQNAIDLFANADTTDISLLMAGPTTGATIPNYLISLAETRKDCVVFVSPELDDVVDNMGSEATDVVTTVDSYTKSSYAVADCNWKYQYDKYNDKYRWIPLNGDIAGLCARTDQQRDPWFSPAGLQRGVIKNVVKLAWNPSKADRDTLYVAGINPVVTLPGEGTLLFGDKTLLNRPSAFDRINVRRLFIVLEKAIAKAARSSLFEFNDEFTRAAFVNLVEPFLRDVKGRRGIYDFRVVCDNTNNTAEVIDGNEFIGDIYIKPARSINFIQLNFVAVRTGVSFDEIVGKF